MNEKIISHLGFDDGDGVGYLTHLLTDIWLLVTEMMLVMDIPAIREESYVKGNGVEV